MPVIQLKTVNLQAKPVGMSDKSLSIRAMKKRVFTEDQWAMLNTQPDYDLRERIDRGDLIISLLYRPEMNITKLKADEVSSNLRFQQDAIQKIIDFRGNNHG